MKSTIPVSVVIPYHDAPGRAQYLARAIESVASQTVVPQQTIVTPDHYNEGAARTRSKGLAQVFTPYVAFLDSDDFFLPNHLEILYDKIAGLPDAGYVFSYFMGVDQFDGFIPDDPLGLYHHKFDVAKPTQTTSTIMVSTRMARGIGGFKDQPDGKLIPGTHHRHGEDYQFTLDCIAVGAQPLHIPVRTWCWRFWSGNTSGKAVPT